MSNLRVEYPSRCARDLERKNKDCVTNSNQYTSALRASATMIYVVVCWGNFRVIVRFGELCFYNNNNTMTHTRLGGITVYYFDLQIPIGICQ